MANFGTGLAQTAQGALDAGVRGWRVGEDINSKREALKRQQQAFDIAAAQEAHRANLRGGEVTIQGQTIDANAQNFDINAAAEGQREKLRPGEVTIQGQDIKRNDQKMRLSDNQDRRAESTTNSRLANESQDRLDQGLDIEREQALQAGTIKAGRAKNEADYREETDRSEDAGAKLALNDIEHGTQAIKTTVEQQVMRARQNRQKWMENKESAKAKEEFLEAIDGVQEGLFTLAETDEGAALTTMIEMEEFAVDEAVRMDRTGDTWTLYDKDGEVAYDESKNGGKGGPAVYDMSQYRQRLEDEKEDGKGTKVAKVDNPTVTEQLKIDESIRDNVMSTSRSLYGLPKEAPLTKAQVAEQDIVLKRLGTINGRNASQIKQKVSEIMSFPKEMDQLKGLKFDGKPVTLDRIDEIAKKRKTTRYAIISKALAAKAQRAAREASAAAEEAAAAQGGGE